VALTLIRTLRLLAAEKKAVLKRQAALVASLNSLLPSIGYRVVPLEAEARAAARPRLRSRRRAAASTARRLVGKPLTCPHCSRTFALPLHLGRHVSVMHKTKKTPAASSTEGGERPAPKVAKARRRPKRRAVRKAAARRRRAARSPRTTAKRPRRASAPPAKG